MVQRKIAKYVIAGCMLLAPVVQAAENLASERKPSRLPTLDSLTANPWLQIGIEALSSGLFSVTIEIGYTPGNTAVDINRAHQGMKLAGWDFVSATSVHRDGTTSGVLLTYQRSPR